MLLANSIKAILVLLVLVDHNDVARYLNEDLLNPLAFHVLGFLALPFLVEQNSRTPITQKLFRYFIPQLLFFTFAVALFQLVMDKNTDSVTVLMSWLIGLATGSGANVKEASGFFLFWFLPCLMSLTLLKHFLGKLSLPKIPLLIGLIVISVAITFIPKDIRDNVPLQILLALHILPQCMLIKILYDRIVLSRLKQVLTILVLLVGAALYWIAMSKGVRLEYSNFRLPDDGMQASIAIFANMLLALSLFLLFTRTDKSKSELLFLSEIGKFSLAIYLIHNFLYVGIRLIAPCCEKIEYNLWLVLAIQVLAAVSLSYLFARIIFFSKRLKSFVFPKDTSDWLRTWKR